MARLDQELARRGLARSRTEAAKLITAGLVSSHGTVLSKASLPVAEDAELTVASSDLTDYVSRAGHKLRGALDAFPDVQVEGRRCLDAGASTGGFTDVLLRSGAREVAAVDVGHDQLVQVLRDDPRVHVFEGMNVRYLEADAIGGLVALTVADLSFISLTLVMGPLASCTEPGGDLVLMVKPQFEVGRERLSRTGVVSSEMQRREAVGKVASSAVQAGLDLRGLAESPLPGQDGNKEYFLWLSRPTGAAPETRAARTPKIDTDEATAGPETEARVAELLTAIWPTPQEQA
ncbi:MULTISPECIES: TlyA family RNA methyltransferase [Arthrobacter]|uniref:TlyA family RNA methyltransferase n=2 Tax=Arthrobacter TaxID=1663 RepID=A0ABU9KNL3_9MICC|nr:TlyA family RNA methyltransferase [Arthrobacter sp. YJM1]MDP5228507.1 TlyA family RNA methyltransferase [Arthrobacter sp. YJM1]